MCLLSVHHHAKALLHDEHDTKVETPLRFARQPVVVMVPEAVVEVGDSGVGAGTVASRRPQPPGEVRKDGVLQWDPVR